MFLMAAGADPTRMDSKGRSAIYWSLRNRDHDLFVFMIDSFNPRCWDSVLQKRVEELLSDLPETHLKILQNQLYNPPSLAKQCRLVIRMHLLHKFNYRSLFLLVPRLPLPVLIQRFLLVIKFIFLIIYDLNLIYNFCVISVGSRTARRGNNTLLHERYQYENLEK